MPWYFLAAHSALVAAATLFSLATSERVVTWQRFSSTMGRLDGPVRVLYQQIERVDQTSGDTTLWLLAAAWTSLTLGGLIYFCVGLVCSFASDGNPDQSVRVPGT